MNTLLGGPHSWTPERIKEMNDAGEEVLRKIERCVMGAASSKIHEVRFVIRDDYTECYVAVEAIGDCPIGVQGWHYKVFGKDLSVQDILAKHFDFLLWPLKAPER